MMVEDLADGRDSFHVLWLQSGGCGGCTMSLLCAESPDLISTLQAFRIRILWHPALSEATGSQVIEILESVRSGETRL